MRSSGVASHVTVSVERLTHIAPSLRSDTLHTIPEVTSDYHTALETVEEKKLCPARSAVKPPDKCETFRPAPGGSGDVIVQIG